VGTPFETSKTTGAMLGQQELKGEKSLRATQKRKGRQGEGLENRIDHAVKRHPEPKYKSARSEVRTLKNGECLFARPNLLWEGRAEVIPRKTFLSSPRSLFVSYVTFLL